MTPGLQRIIDVLESRSHGPRTLDPATLAQALRHPVTIDDVAPFIRFDVANYVRALVTKTDHWELRLLCWKPAQGTTIHGHRGAACAFRIVRGSAQEMILGERDRTWVAGAVVEESSVELIHQVSNVSRAPADSLLTLHAYSPPLPVDAPSTRSGRNVVIVGGGFSGASLAYHLLRRADGDLRITIVEGGPLLGRGVAYGVDSTIYRLNVPAERMSIDPDVPNDFVTWTHAVGQPEAALQRTAYGAYVVDRFGRALNGAAAKVRLFRGAAAQVSSDGVRVSTGELLPADVVVLATGIAPRITPSWPVADARVIDAWDECGLATLPKQGRILVLGSGLSALDVVGLLDARRFEGVVVVLSRNGLLPRPDHAPSPDVAALSAEAMQRAPATLRGLIRWMRELAQAEPWPLAVAQLRPHLSELWHRLSPRDRARFVRSVRPFWDVLDHSAPAGTLAVVERMRAAGRLEVVAGRVARCDARPEGLDLEMTLRNGGRLRYRFDAIVRGVGPALGSSDVESPLLQSLLGEGSAALDPAGLGIVTDDRGALVSREGRSSDRYFALGALRRASHWGGAAVPEISVHARALAEHLLG